MDMRDFFLLTVLLACTYQISVVLAQSTATAGAACTTQNATSATASNATFLFCTNMQWVTVYCLSGSTFDSASGTCAGAVSTTTASTTTTATSSGNNISVNGSISCTSSNNGATFPYQSSNTQFYLCVNGQAVLAQCASNSIFNPTTGSCSSNNNVNNGYYSCPYGIILLPAPNDCRSFVSCVNGRGTLKPCPMGLYFSPTMSACTINIPSTCYYSNVGGNYPGNYPGYYPGYYPNGNSNLGTNYGTNSFPIYEASCYPNCNTNNNYNYGQNYQPVYGIV